METLERHARQAYEMLVSNGVQDLAYTKKFLDVGEFDLVLPGLVRRLDREGITVPDDMRDFALNVEEEERKFNNAVLERANKRYAQK